MGKKRIVQKYGGTSVGSIHNIQRVAERVCDEAKQDKEIAVVVSAMAGETNRLVELVRQANPNASPRSYDVAVSAGEQVSVGLVCAAIERLGLPAEPVLGFQLGLRTDSNHAQARILQIDSKRIEQIWSRGAIPVVAGFQGVSSEDDVTTLGRGGSDTSAVALAVALNASFCEINTDVDAIYSADPRIVPNALPISRIDYDTALEVAALGGKVLHSRCVELGAKYKMPIVVRSSFDGPNGRTTMVANFDEADALEAPVVSAISLDADVVRVNCRGMASSPMTISKLFASIAEHGANVDIISHNRSHDDLLEVGFTVSSKDSRPALEAIRSLSADPLFRGVEVSVLDNLSKVSAVGLGMKSHSGVAAKVFETLSAASIELLMVATSEIKISCVVSRDHGQAAVKALHISFFGK